MSDDLDPLVPFAARPPAPGRLRIPAALVAVVALALVVGALAGQLSSTGSPAHRALRGVFFASAFAYLIVSLVDFWEHFRLEKQATGRYLTATVLPPGESLNHAATGAVVVATLVLARPLPTVLEPRDWFVVLAPAAFLALGWRDELVYHRRRCAHREDIMHTVAHLAAGVMMCSFLSTKLFVW